jgi:hypothetical protein
VVVTQVISILFAEGILIVGLFFVFLFFAGEIVKERILLFSSHKAWMEQGRIGGSIGATPMSPAVNAGDSSGAAVVEQCRWQVVRRSHGCYVKRLLFVCRTNIV